MKPEFVDNRELKLVDALSGHLDWLKQTYAQPVELCVATGYFNADGFALIADSLDGLREVRLLLGAEPVAPPARPLRKPGDPSGTQFEAKLVNEALRQNSEGLLRDRNLLAFDPQTDRCVQRLLAFLATGKIKVKRYEKAFLHGKAYLFDANEGVICGSSNFTAAGLTCNLELNLGHYQPTTVDKVRAWFDDLWDKAEPFDLAAVYAARYDEYSPYLIYLRVLWERYRDELEQEAEGTTRIRLTTFQTDGIFRAKRILEQFNGVLIADAVGLGKTFVGGELIREVVEDRRQRALLIAPAALRDGTWERFKHSHQIYLESISYEQLAAEKQLGGDQAYLQQRANDYALVVIDEAQAFRNPDTARARALRKLLQGHPPKKLVLMSATPVNNSLWDLYYLLTYFVRHDAAFAELGVRSLKDRISDAVGRNPDELRPDLLFDILDATTVRRTRSFVCQYYPNDRVLGPGGIEVPIRFPKPHLESIGYSLDDVLPGFFDGFADAIMPEEGEPELSLARYTPTRYKKGAQASASEAALLGLLRSGLLKRFESSVHAFAKTLDKLVRAHEIFLDGLDHGVILSAEQIDEWAQVDNDEVLDELIAESGSTPCNNFNVPQLRGEVENDRDLLAKFAGKARKVTRASDPKLRSLIVDALRPILERARKEAKNDDDFRDKRKVIIFTYFADTVDWILEYLLEVIDKDKSLLPYRGRVVAVVGDESPSGVSREEAVFGFAPRSSEAPPGMDDDLFDIIVTTDVLAEGMNLQQCRNVINYDLPWNPMRLVQRHGRIDRIGSPHDDVYIWCFFPDARLESLLDLESRIRRKVAQAAASVGVEHEVIPGAATSDRVFAETCEEIERLKENDPALFITAGEPGNSQSGEAYRQELRKGLEHFGDRVTDLPWGSGSGMLGSRTGHFFCGRVGDRVFLRFVPADATSILRDSLTCLRLIGCREDTPRLLTDEMRESAYDAWSRARQDIFNEWQFSTDPANLQPKVRPILRAAATQLRKFPPKDLSQQELDTIIDSVEAPWGGRIEKQIREALAAGQEASSRIVETVRRLGLEPFRAPQPLPPIEEHDITLICWLAIKEETK